MRRRALLLCSCLALSLTACGGGGGSAGEGTASQAPAEPTAAQPHSLPGHPKLSTEPRASQPAPRPQANRYGGLTRAGAKARERRAAQRQRAKQRRLAQSAAKAAPFLVPSGDNSIPTYGKEASASEQSQAEAQLRAYLQARQGGDWSAACEGMAKPIQAQLALLAGSPQSQGDCPAAYAKLSKRIPAAARQSPLSGPLTAFRVKEGKGFALFYGPGAQQFMMPMVAEGGSWRVSQLEAVAWPVGSGA